MILPPSSLLVLALKETFKRLYSSRRLTDDPSLFNLAFGDKNEITGELDDLSISNNGDTEKILSTVAASLYLFFNYYPDAFVYATGSTPSRTRLYQISIAKVFTEMNNDFILLGQTNTDWELFRIGGQYKSFLVKKKIL